MRQPCVYILTNKPLGTLYIGVTSNLAARLESHKTAPLSSFVRRYNLHQLVWSEAHEDMDTAIAREKAIKKWNREWKIDLIEASNPNWEDILPY